MVVNELNGQKLGLFALKQGFRIYNLVGHKAGIVSLQFRLGSDFIFVWLLPREKVDWDRSTKGPVRCCRKTAKDPWQLWQLERVNARLKDSATFWSATFFHMKAALSIKSNGAVARLRLWYIAVNKWVGVREEQFVTVWRGSSLCHGEYCVPKNGRQLTTGTVATALCHITHSKCFRQSVWVLADGASFFLDSHTPYFLPPFTPINPVPWTNTTHL